MNACSIRTAGRRGEAKWLWFFRYGFGVWIGKLIVTIGYDVRPQTQDRKWNP